MSRYGLKLYVEQMSRLVLSTRLLCLQMRSRHPRHNRHDTAGWTERRRWIDDSSIFLCCCLLYECMIALQLLRATLPAEQFCFVDLLKVCSECDSFVMQHAPPCRRQGTIVVLLALSRYPHPACTKIQRAGILGGRRQPRCGICCTFPAAARQLLQLAAAVFIC